MMKAYPIFPFNKTIPNNLSQRFIEFVFSSDI